MTTEREKTLAREDAMGEGTDSRTAMDERAGSEPSPTPWRVLPSGMRDVGGELMDLPAYVLDAAGEEVAVCYADGDTRADFIVRAVNAHEALVSALKETKAALAAAMRVMAADRCFDTTLFQDELRRVGIADGVGVRANSALALAEGK